MHSVLFWRVILWLIGYSCGGWLNPSPVYAQTTPQPYTICGASLNSSWVDWSWNTARTYDHAMPDGGRSLLLQYRATGAGLYLHATTPVSLAGFTHLNVWLYSQGNNQPIRVILNNQEPALTVTTVANEWALVSVPLSAFGNPASLSDIYLQEIAGSTRPAWAIKTLYLNSSNDAATPVLDLLVLPNPVDNRQPVTLRCLGFGANDSVQVSFIDGSGRIVQVNDGRLLGGDIQLWLEGLPGGVYVVRVAGERGTVARKIVLF